MVANASEAPISESNSSTENLMRPLKNLRRNLLNVLQTAEKDNMTEMNIKLTHVKNSLDQVRESINSTPDIRHSTDYQYKKINDLHRQIEIKNNFINGFRKQKPEEMETSWNKTE